MGKKFINPKVGDVCVLLSKPNEKFIIVAERNYENCGSCSFERDYTVIKLNKVLDLQYISQKDCYLIKVRSTSFPIKVLEDEASFDLKREIRYEIMRK